MPRTLYTPRHEALCALLRDKRLKSGLTQSQVAKMIGRYQSFIADVERGERRLDVIEFVEIAEVLGLNPATVVKSLQRVRRN